ncbi:39S ribosomal protein L41, mitochondrial [Orchesella cincta]|uniref:39S ribosomal protein L41, mitochondrial n=1 Tax=Orchesella cincta TaxID=48709 RepID=A0A1D2M2L1_ORCCI|nr:39S ribosomal protein L41, mitochondrial [Orchesella cincta]
MEGKTASWDPIYTEVKASGFHYDGVYHKVPEMIPDIILKPYVSYKTADIYQTEFTPENLFESVYKNKIVRDFKNNKLDDQGNPLEPNEMEKLTPEEAWIIARKSGSDIFSERTPKFWNAWTKV